MYITVCKQDQRQVDRINLKCSKHLFSVLKAGANLFFVRMFRELIAFFWEIFA